MPIGRARQAGVSRRDLRQAGLSATGKEAASQQEIDPSSGLISKMADLNSASVVGIKWPLEFRGGRVALSVDEKHILQSIRQIIGINRYEYLMKPDFGADLDSRIFDPVNVISLAERDIRYSINRWEPRAKLNRVDADMSRVAEGLVTIMMDVEIGGQRETLPVGIELRR